MINDLGLQQPPNGIVRSVEEGLRLAKVFAYPMIVRPSYVLGGRAMKVVYSEQELTDYMTQGLEISSSASLLLDHFLDDAIEVDIDAVSDGHDILIGGILEHIEQAGVHSGDSSCTLPPHSLDPSIQDQLRDQMCQLAKSLGVIGLINAQFAIQGENIYVLEVNPLASRTIPFYAKATGVPLAKIAACCMVGISLREQGYETECIPPYFCVKKPVFPFNKFPGADPILGPEMRSTGEVMGIADSFGRAFSKAQFAAGDRMPKDGCAFISVRDADKSRVVKLARQFQESGFRLVATHGTAMVLKIAGLDCALVHKVLEERPNIVDMIKNGDIHFIVNTTESDQAIKDSHIIRSSAIQHKVCYTTTLAGGEAAMLALQVGDPCGEEVQSLQDLHRQCRAVAE